MHLSVYPAYVNVNGPNILASLFSTWFSLPVQCSVRNMLYVFFSHADARRLLPMETCIVFNNSLVASTTVPSNPSLLATSLSLSYKVISRIVRLLVLGVLRTTNGAPARNLQAQVYIAWVAAVLRVEALGTCPD